jgi:hypothetical protein
MCFVDLACCCCSKTNLKRNVYMWAMFDMVLNVWFLLCTFAVAKHAELIGFCILVILLDLMLLAATYYRKTKLVILWQICLAVYIVILVLGCIIAMPILLAQPLPIDPTPNNVTSTPSSNSTTTSTTITTTTTTTTTTHTTSTTTKRSKNRGTSSGSKLFNLMSDLNPPGFQFGVSRAIILEAI